MSADAIVITIGQYSQEPGLEFSRHITDFVQKQRAAFGLFEASVTNRAGAGKRPLLMTEEFGFH